MNRLAAAFAVLVLAGCADSTGPKDQRTPGLVLWTAVSSTDTVDAGPILVYARLLDDRLQPVAFSKITFSALQPPASYMAAFADSGAARPAAAVFTATTNFTGEVAVALWHGTLAGTASVKGEARDPQNASVVISADSIPLVTLPGHPQRVKVSPADTALYQGRGATIVGQVVDRYGNPRAERGTLTPLTPGLTVSGATVTATAGPSRQRLRATWQDLADTGYISIVPRGTIAVRVLGRPGPAYSYLFASLQLDGSDFTPILSRLSSPQYGTWVGDNGPQWVPGDSTIIFFDGGQYTRLYRTTRAGAVTPVLPSSASLDDFWPQITADSQWVYFARSSRASYESYIYRCHLDGSQLEQVTATVGPYTNDLYPSPSPDGRYVVYATDRESSGDIFNLHLQVVDTETGAVRSLGTAGTIPRWSPNGDLIVFGRGNALWLVAPDGTGLRQLTAADRGYKAWASWSPDGKWIAAEHYAPDIDIIEVATGMTLPLAFTGYLGLPTWHR